MLLLEMLHKAERRDTHVLAFPFIPHLTFCREHQEKRWAGRKKQSGIKIAGRNINNLRYADDTTLMAKSEEELKSLLMKLRRGE